MATTTTQSTITDLNVVMFTVADPDAARDFYTGTLGFELRADIRFGENGENRWLEVAPPGSPCARLALNPPMGGSEPGGGAIGVSTPDVHAEYARLKALGANVMSEPMTSPGAPVLFMMSDPDGNVIAVVQEEQG